MGAFIVGRSIPMRWWVNQQKRCCIIQNGIFGSVGRKMPLSIFLNILCTSDLKQNGLQQHSSRTHYFHLTNMLRYAIDTFTIYETGRFSTLQSSHESSTRQLKQHEFYIGPVIWNDIFRLHISFSRLGAVRSCFSQPFWTWTFKLHNCTWELGSIIHLACQPHSPTLELALHNIWKLDISNQLQETSFASQSKASAYPMPYNFSGTLPFFGKQKKASVSMVREIKSKSLENQQHCPGCGWVETLALWKIALSGRWEGKVMWRCKTWSLHRSLRFAKFKITNMQELLVFEPPSQTLRRHFQVFKTSPRAYLDV